MYNGQEKVAIRVITLRGSWERGSKFDKFEELCLSIHIS